MPSTDGQIPKTSLLWMFLLRVYPSQQRILPAWVLLSPWNTTPISFLEESLPQPVSEWFIITNRELGISIKSPETLRKRRAYSETITRSAVSHHQHGEPGEVYTCFGDTPFLICWCLIAVNIKLMLGKLWVLTLPLAFIISIVLLGMLWSSYRRPMRQTTIQPGWLWDAINKAWGKMPQCRTVLPSALQLHPALLLLLLKWETPVSLFSSVLAVISTSCTGTCPWVSAERTKIPVCRCCYRVHREGTLPHLPPPGWRSACVDGRVSRAAPLPCSCQALNTSSGGLGAASASALCCRGRLYLDFAHLTAPSAGRLRAGKNDVKKK